VQRAVLQPGGEDVLAAAEVAALLLRVRARLRVGDGVRVRVRVRVGVGVGLGLGLGLGLGWGLGLGLGPVAARLLHLGILEPGLRRVGHPLGGARVEQPRVAKALLALAQVGHLQVDAPVHAL
jgi:hypothetical protein